ncbi:exodeoxyribonuclease VII small subunit [Cellulomonas alba]|uniref:Exodeoxyribonuclease 7 small subunit n=1 Tax=Cellulomonas alba TaxID=3053467 RepID=A0ABT7SHH5_9CELL|nr:exodeoxyribonuclease VII small subunit [Cellulomonas alba]MDM7855637.1 exodeoxyribonuclease VII small subunit [Cellulomonas alba]
MPKQPSPATPPTAGGAAPSAADSGVAALTYEQARDELVSVVGRLESGAATLEESLALWERGEALAARCQQWLDGARDRLAAARGASGDAAGAGPSGDVVASRGDAGDEPDGFDGQDDR